MEYRRELDGLRALSVTSVILFHAGLSAFAGGFVGVDIFFVISGYLITSIILNEHQKGVFSLVAFYERRMRRILPALLFVLIVCVPFAWLWMLPEEMKDFSRSLIAVPLFLSNLYFRQDTGYFAADADLKPLLHTWSLAVEEQYYLFFPALVLILFALRKALVLPVITVMAVGSFLHTALNADVENEKLFFETAGRVWEIFAGALIPVIGEHRIRSRLSGGMREVASLCGLILILGVILLSKEGAASPSAATALPVLGAMIVIVCGTPDTCVGKLLGWAPFVGLGLISYSTYLWHQPLLAFVRIGSFGASHMLSIVSACLLSLLCGFLSWNFIEQPFRKRDLLMTRTVASVVSVTSVALILLGLWGSATNGFESRFGKRQKAVSLQAARETRLRAQDLRPGLCQFTGKHGHKDIETFIAKWRCDQDAAHPELVKAPIIIVGDSHSADIVSAVRLNGYLPVQTGGSGCSLVPSIMSARCRRLFDFVKEFAQNNPFYTHIILANRYSKSELSEKSILEMAEYWSLPTKHLMFVSARPEFPNYKRALVGNREPAVDLWRAEQSTSEQILKLLRTRNIALIDSKELFCSLTPTCASHDATGAPFTTDGNHFTRHGAQLFGKQMIERGLLPVSSTRSTSSKGDPVTNISEGAENP